MNVPVRPTPSLRECGECGCMMREGEYILAVDNNRLVPSAHLGPGEGVHQLHH